MLNFWDGWEIILSESALENLMDFSGPKLIPIFKISRSNSFRARRYHDFARASIFGHLISVGGQLVALQVFNVSFYHSGLTSGLD